MQTVLLFTVIKPTFEPNQFFPCTYLFLEHSVQGLPTKNSKNYVRRYLKFSRSLDLQRLQLHSIWYRKGILFEYEKVYDDSCKKCTYFWKNVTSLILRAAFFVQQDFFIVANYLRYLVDTPVYSPAVLKWIEPAQKLT